jgi:hypothetical protein
LTVDVLAFQLSATERADALIPVPNSAICIGELGALLKMLNEPGFTPALFGSNPTFTVALWPGVNLTCNPDPTL